ncbi:hypothetical protein BKA58DRAFT_401690 [Alternaria rosae]|uniref:uncharacterized protein n=1 Tax=Alternaria rosae TaxID=1187941 RepID=UPI001E8D6F22|nr:uncharacterized protein BKA58DRAFT_401690 [Alternaria rosae]KAH6870121.1 hypothetical protein BKA58DRAFT_401690 [Alternaria rosae]
MSTCPLLASHHRVNAAPNGHVHQAICDEYDPEKYLSEHTVGQHALPDYTALFLQKHRHVKSSEPDAEKSTVPPCTVIAGLVPAIMKYMISQHEGALVKGIVMASMNLSITVCMVFFAYVDKGYLFIVSVLFSIFQLLILSKQ